MNGVPLRDQYTKLDRWAEQLPHDQYSVLMGAVFGTVWTIMEIALGGQSIVMAVLLGLVGGIINGGLHYFWRK